MSMHRFMDLYECVCVINNLKDCRHILITSMNSRGALENNNSLVGLYIRYKLSFDRKTLSKKKKEKNCCGRYKAIRNK